MNFRLMTKDLAIEVFSQWWPKYEQDIPPNDMLPETFCCVTDDEGIPVCVIAFILTETKTAFLGWLTAAPEIRGSERTEAIQQLMMGVEEYAKELGFSWLWFPTGHKGIVSRLTKLGYVIAKEGACESLLKDLR